MDRQTREAWRAVRSDPGDERLQERLKRLVARMFHRPEDRFQQDIALGGRIERALMYDMDYRRCSVHLKKHGALIWAGPRYGPLPTAVRIWYPSRKAVIRDLLPSDIRVSIVCKPSEFTDLCESLEERLAGATIVSAQVANVQEDNANSWSWRDQWSRPKRRADIDLEALAAVESVIGSNRGSVQGASSWV